MRQENKLSDKVVDTDTEIQKTHTSAQMEGRRGWVSWSRGWGGGSMQMERYV